MEADLANIPRFVNPDMRKMLESHDPMILGVRAPLMASFTFFLLMHVLN